MADFPATLANNIAEQVSSIGDREHWMGELGVTEHLRVSEGVLLRHQYLEIVHLNVFLFELGRNCLPFDRDLETIGEGYSLCVGKGYGSISHLRGWRNQSCCRSTARSCNGPCSSASTSRFHSGCASIGFDRQSC